jgi:hypothetical protein
VRWARDLVCVTEVGRCGYMGFLLLYVKLIIVRSMVSYCVCCRNYIYIYIYIYIYVYNVQHCTKIWFL